VHLLVNELCECRSTSPELIWMTDEDSLNIEQCFGVITKSFCF